MEEIHAGKLLAPDFRGHTFANDIPGAMHCSRCGKDQQAWIEDGTACHPTDAELTEIMGESSNEDGAEARRNAGSTPASPTSLRGLLDRALTAVGKIRLRGTGDDALLGIAHRNLRMALREMPAVEASMAAHARLLEQQGQIRARAEAWNNACPCGEPLCDGQVEPPTCSAQAVSRGIPHGFYDCELPPGHRGPHRDGSAEWTGA